MMSKNTEKYSRDIIEDILTEISPQEQKRTDNRMMLASKIKDGMDAKGWKNKHLANALNQQPSVITKWLSGTHNFTSDTLSDIEDVLGIKLFAVEEDKVSQVIHYHLNVTSTVVNNSIECNSLSPNTKQLIPNEKNMSNEAVC
jgi:ribosome-binding protein aMBF1 (putative translation factor)